MSSDADVAGLVADEAAVAADVGLLPQPHRYRLLARAAKSPPGERGEEEERRE